MPSLSSRVFYAGCADIRDYPPFFSPVELFLFLLKGDVEFMEINIGKQWAEAAALRCSGVGLVLDVGFDVSCFQELTHQMEEAFVEDALAQNGEQRLMVQMVEETLEYPPLSTSEPLSWL